MLALMLNDDGWENCHKAISNAEVFPKHDIEMFTRGRVKVEWDSDAPEFCSECGQMGKEVQFRTKGINQMTQYLTCRECGTTFVRPIRDGIIITSEEEIA